MRWLNLILVACGMTASGQAFALPQPDAETAYARGDYATAYALWLPLAEQGSPRAQLIVARMYERGEGVAPDKAAAAEWYRKAAAQGVTTPEPGPATEPGTPMPVVYQGATGAAGYPYPAYPYPVSYPVVTPYPAPRRVVPPSIVWSTGHHHHHHRHSRH